MIKNSTNAEIVSAALAGREAQTTTGNMSTRNATAYCGSAYRMPKAWAKLFSDRFDKGLIRQVIYSYSTPIAWLDSEHGWIIPDATYSITTSTKHQSKLYRLGGRHIALPYDATIQDARRAIAGELVFVTKGYGQNRVFTGTIPGPAYRVEA